MALNRDERKKEYFLYLITKKQKKQQKHVPCYTSQQLMHTISNG